jgi:hypothetical protein
MESSMKELKDLRVRTRFQQSEDPKKSLPNADGTRERRRMTRNSATGNATNVDDTRVTGLGTEVARFFEKFFK